MVCNKTNEKNEHNFQKLRFELKDKDILNQDDAVGGAEVDLDDYVSKGENTTVEISRTNGATLTMTKTKPIRFKLSARFD